VWEKLDPLTGSLNLPLTTTTRDDIDRWNAVRRSLRAYVTVGGEFDQLRHAAG